MIKNRWVALTLELAIMFGLLGLCYALGDAGLKYPVVAGFWIGRLGRVLETMVRPRG